ncbi:MAG TPA: ATP-binding protein, partial [Kofleriaceae bacterium]|nr:ATP-binding protein [Kofleriaceae bacterium]
HPSGNTNALVASVATVVPEAKAQTQVRRPPVQQTQVVQIDNNSFTQNNEPNFVYQQQRAVPNAPMQQAQRNAADPANTTRQAANPGNTPAQQSANPSDASQQAANAGNTTTQQAANPGDASVTSPPGSPSNPLVPVIVSAFEWKTLPFQGTPTLVAVRSVQMPDRALAQGFVVDRSTLTSWLASRAGDSVAELRTEPRASRTTRPDDEPAAATLSATEIAPGWHLAVSPNPRAVVEAEAEVTHIEHRFMLRFGVVGVLAALAAVFVVLLVARSEALARERSQFAAAAAHELRTPLAGLQLYGDMLADGLGDPAKVRDYARRMSEEASRLGRVVSNVLGFSQLERGNLSVEARVGPLGEALRELADRARPALDRAGAKLELEITDVDARFDRDALARIVANLLDNAEKYSRGADDRTIGLVANAQADGIEIAVADHGPGVDVRGRTALFQPFKRGVTADGPAGLGLGLALSQSLARAMDGDLAYRPTPEGGATFVLRLAKA